MIAAAIVDTSRCPHGLPEFHGPDHCDFRCPGFPVCPLGAGRSKLVPVEEDPDAEEGQL